MGTPRGVLQFVERLEYRIGTLVSGPNRVALAYSGGLSSTLLAMLARKRCDLVCVVAGVDGSADVRAAKSAKDHLDYPIRYVYLDAAGTRRLREDVESSHRGLSSAAVRALVPLRAVNEEVQADLFLAGFGAARGDAKFGAVLRDWKVQCPLMDLTADPSLTRPILRAAAVYLGLPLQWARVTHRAPATGAGIVPFLQTAGLTML